MSKWERILEKSTLISLFFCVFFSVLATGVEMFSGMIQIFLCFSALFSLFSFAFLLYRKRFFCYIKDGIWYFIFALCLFLVSTVKYVISLYTQQGITFFTVYQIVILAGFGFFTYAYLSERPKYFSAVLGFFSYMVTAIILLWHNRFMLDQGVYRFMALYENPNILGLFAVFSCFASLYQISRKSRFLLLHVLCFSIGAAAVFLSSSRTCLAALLGGLLVFGVLSIPSVRKDNWKIILRNLVLIALATTISYFAFSPNENDKLQAVVIGEGISSEQEQQEEWGENVDNTADTATVGETSEAGDADVAIVVDDETEKQSKADRFSLSNDGSGSILNNLRFRIWSEYLGRASDYWLFGTDYSLSERPVIDDAVRDSHNTFIYTFFLYGILGILLLLALAVSILVRFFVKRNRSVPTIAIFSMFIGLMVISCLNDLLNVPIFFMVLAWSMAALGYQENAIGSMPQRVLQVFSCLNKGGAESRTMDVYRHLDREQVQFDFVVSTPNPENQFFYSEIQALGGRVYEIQSWKKTGIFPYFSQWRRVFRAGGYRIVHAHLSLDCWFPLFFAWLNGVPRRISHARCSGGGESSEMKPWVILVKRGLINLLSTDKIYCSDKASDYVFGKHCRDKEHTYFLPNAIDLTHFSSERVESKQQIKDSLGVSNFTYLIGTVGNSRPVKNHIFLVRAFHQFLQLVPNTALIIVGNSEQDTEAKQYVETHGLNNHVFFLGVRTDVCRLLEIFDVFVLPSFHEGAPGSVVEAQAANVPCILSDSITRSVDVGTGLLKYLPLESSLQTWAEEMLRSCTMQRPNHAQTEKKLRNAGYDIASSVQKLLKIYERNG